MTMNNESRGDAGPPAVLRHRPSGGPDGPDSPLDEFASGVTSPRLRALLAEPVGTPFELTGAEALELVRAAAGSATGATPTPADLAAIRRSLGHSLVEGGRKPGSSPCRP